MSDWVWVVRLSLIISLQPIEVLEAELLNGQKLQGPLTAKEVHDVLVEDGKTEQ